MKRLLSLLAILIVALSCNDEQLDREETQIDLFVKSDSFKELDLDPNDLDLSGGMIFHDQTGQKSLAIASLNQRTYVFASILDAGGFQNTFSVEFITDLNTELLTSSIQENRYNGKMKFTFNPENQIILSVNEGVLESLEKAKLGSKLKACGTFLSDAWVYNVNWCVDQRMQAMNWLEYGECIIGLPGCYGRLVVYCMIDNCAIP